MAWKSEAETTDAAVASSQLDLLKSPARKTKPKLLFPWVHSPDPPRRLIEREAHFRGNRVFDYKTSCTTISALTARAHLEVPFWKILLGSNSWKEELADNCSWAFCQSVAGILSNTYDVPMAKIVSEDDEDGELMLEFEFSPTTNQNNNNNNEKPDNKSATNEQSDNSYDTMMEARLRNVFSSANKSGKNQIEVLLKTKPTGAEIHSLHSLPALSRSIAERYPKLIKDIEQIRVDGDASSAYVNLVVAETDEDVIETTTFAEVLVYCDEVFRVRDIETGAVIQGYEDGKVRKVIHGVRMERVRTSSLGKGKSLSNWLITDIDDLCDGNRWFKPKGLPWFNSG